MKCWLALAFEVLKDRLREAAFTRLKVQLKVYLAFKSDTGLTRAEEET